MEKTVITEKIDYLDRILQDHRSGHMNRKELEGKLFMHIRKKPWRFFLTGFKNDTLDDFISWLYPRLSRAVDHYTDMGSSFDTYIISMVKLSAKEYCMRKKEHRIIEKAWWDAKAVEMAVAEEEQEYHKFPPVPSSEAVPEKVPNPRQILMLLLKSYYYMSDDYLEQLAPALDMEKEELFYMVDKLRVMRVKREQTLNGYKERIHGQYYRCLAFEKRLQAAAPNSAHSIKMQRSLQTARKRLSALRSRLKKMRTEASNGQVAWIMGVKKGTVDSNLFAVRQRNNHEKSYLEKPNMEHLNYSYDPGIQAQNAAIEDDQEQ